MDSTLLIPLIAIIADIAIGALKNSSIPYKGLILSFLSMLGSAAAKLKDR